jgi:hypothetical protein
MPPYSTLHMEAVGFSETLVSTRMHSITSQNSDLHIHCSGNLSSLKLDLCLALHGERVYVALVSCSSAPGSNHGRATNNPD